MSTPAPAPAAPAPQAPAAPAPEAVSTGEMDVGAFSAALAQKPGEQSAAPSEEQQMEQQIKAQTEAKAAPNKEPEKPAAKEAEKPTTKGEGEKSPFDDLPSEEVEQTAEEKPTAPEEEEVNTDNWPKKQREAFAAARVKEKRLRDELTKSQEALKQLQTEYDQAKQSGKPDEATLKELEELRQWRYSEDVKKSPEWRDGVETPINQVFDNLKQIAESLGVDNEALIKATDEPLSFKRNAAIRRVLTAASEAAENPMDPIELQAAADAAIAEAAKLPDLYAKASILEAKAQETWQALQNRTEDQKAQEAKQAEADFVKAREHIFPQLQKRWPSLLKESADVEAVQNATIAESAEDRALQAQTAALFKPTLKQLFAARAKIAEMEKTIAAWKGTKADVTSAQPHTSKPDDGEMDEDAFASALRQRR